MLQSLQFFLFFILIAHLLTGVSFGGKEEDEKSPLIKKTQQPQPSPNILPAIRKLEVSIDELKESFAITHNLSAIETISVQPKREGNNLIRENLTPEIASFIKKQMPLLHSLEVTFCNIPIASLKILGDSSKLETLRMANTHLGSSVTHLSAFVSLSRLSLPDNELTDSDLEALKTIPNLTFLDISSNSIRGKGLIFLSKLIKLTCLNLAKNELNGEGMKNFPIFPVLCELDLKSTAQNGTSIAKNNFQEGDLFFLQNYPNLHILKIGGNERNISPFLSNLNYRGQKLPTPLLGQASSCLLSLTKLEELDGFDSAVNDESLESIGKLTSLKKLNLGTSIHPPATILAKHEYQLKLESYQRSPKIEGGGLKYLVSLENLESLALNGQLIGTGAVHIGRLNSLTYLSLEGCGLRDNDISTLGMLDNLTHLNLLGNKISKGTRYLAGLKKLKTLNLLFNYEECECHDGTGNVISLLDDESVMHLSGLVSLISLKLGTNRLTPKSIDFLKQLTNLSELELTAWGGFFVSEEQKRQSIARDQSRYRTAEQYSVGTYLPKIEYLNHIENTIKKKKTIGVFSPEEYQRLQQELPECKIKFENRKEMLDRNNKNDCCNII